jgi:hypothetical protein
MGKLLIFLGIIVLIVGLIVEFIPQLPLGRLPGDIRIEKEGFRFYFPITTCILISLLFLLVNYLWNKLR